MSSDPADFHDLLTALTDLRRFWDRPDRKRRLLAELGEPVELGVLRTLVVVASFPAEQDEDRGVGAVGRALQVDDSTASRLVDQAVRGGYLTRQPGGSDRRRTSLELTPAGEVLATRTMEIRCRWLSDITADWSPEEVATLARLLRRFLDGAMSWEDPDRER